MIRAIRLNVEDNVATLVDPGKPGDQVTLGAEGAESLVLGGEIGYGHKVAIRDIASGDSVIKYGKVIGQATQSIKVGEHVHVHNVEALRGRGDKN